MATTVDGRERRLLVERGQAHERRGEIDEAASCFLRAAAHEDAARVLVALGRFVEAGQALLIAGGYVRGRTLSPDPVKRKLVLKAAICFGRGGEVKPAVELYLAIGERARALELLRSVGDHVNAARLEADRTGRVVSAWTDDQPGTDDESTRPDHRRDAGKALEASGKLDAALEAYARNRQPADAARVALALGREAEAAAFLVSAGKLVEAATLYRKAGGGRRALELLAQVGRDNPRYRDAAVMAIELSAEQGALSYDIEHMLGRFVAAGPDDERQAEAFYRLAALYEQTELTDNARDCYRTLLAKRPGFRDAAHRLNALERDTHGSSDDIERVFSEDQAFSAASRRGTPIAMVSVGALPDLPDLPDLPPLPGGAQPAAPDRPLQMRGTGTQALDLSLPRPTPVVGVSTATAMAPGAPPPPATIAEGLLVNGRYRLDKKIGQGGMGAVFRATDLELDEQVAIKFLTAVGADDQTLGRFKQEVSLSRQFNHPNIIRLYDLGLWGDHRFISMELLSGRDLSNLVGSAMDLDRALDYLVQACTALQAVHDKGVIHRDIKPENFFVTDVGVIKVMDFGIAKRGTAGKGLTKAGMMAGTPQYMAPEQINDFGNVTTLADIYSVGCIAYQLITGKVPFDAPELMPILVAHLTQAPLPPRRANPRIPPSLEVLVLKLLSKRPADRLQSCREVAGELARIRMDLPVTR